MKKLIAWALMALTPIVAYAAPVRASFYSSSFEGRLMSNGHPYHTARVSGASLTYPLGSVLLVRSVSTGKELQVTITDRGPWVAKFSLDLSGEAFKELGFDPRAGWGWVTIRRLR